MRKRLLAFFTAVIFFVMPQVTLAADMNENMITPRWTYVYSISALVTPNGFVGGGVILEDDNDFLLIVQLQEDDGSGWSTIETWSLEGNYSGAIEEYYDLDSDSEYRAKVTAKVFTDLGRLVETVSIYSDPV